MSHLADVLEREADMVRYNQASEVRQPGFTSQHHPLLAGLPGVGSSLSASVSPWCIGMFGG